MGGFLYSKDAEASLGATLDEEGTTFRVFAPRAKSIVAEIQTDRNLEREHLDLHSRSVVSGKGVTGSV